VFEVIEIILQGKQLKKEKCNIMDFNFYVLPPLPPNFSKIITQYYEYPLFYTSSYLN